MKRRPARPRPPRSATRRQLPTRASHTTVPKTTVRAPTRRPSKPVSTVGPKLARSGPRQIGRIVDEEESSLMDLIDNLLAKGVMLNADLVLALANVDLVYVRLSALLCAADRILPRPRKGGP